MLKRLSIRDFILIEELDIDFMSGFHVLTGETGAGKSIIIGALMQLLGAKASKDLVRSGCTKSSLQASFDLEESTFVNLYGLDERGSGELIITKEILSTGKSITKVNGLMLSMRELKELSTHLVSAVGQDDKLKIYDTKEQLKVVDAFLSEDARLLLKKEVASLYAEFKKLESELEELKDLDERAIAREKDLIQYQISEIDEAELKKDDEDIETSYKKMKNSETILAGLGEASYLIDNGDEGGLSAMIQTVIKTLEGLASLEDRVEDSIEALKEVNYSLRDSYADLERIAASYQFEEADFMQLEKRLDLLNSLKKKYGNSLEEILAYREKLDERLLELDTLSKRRGVLEEEMLRLRERYADKAGLLSLERKKSCLDLSHEVSSSLKDLSFVNAEFRVDFNSKTGVYEDGTDEVEFMVRLNSGMDFAPLKKVASGGEASRIMLALQEVLAGSYAPPLLIFDEIDAGISGRAAMALAERIYRVSKAHQVILISHTLQVALYADHQYLIKKEDDGEKTHTEVKLLTDEERVQEVCRLIGTSSESKGLMEEAKKMIDSVKKIKKKIK